MRQVFAIAGFALGGASDICGDETVCSGSGHCASNETATGLKYGLKYGCVPAGDVGCSDKRFSCPQSFDCDIIGYQCNSSLGGPSVPLITNEPAERTVVSSYKGLCSLIENDLPQSCNCKDYKYGGRLECDVAIDVWNWKDTVGVAVDIAICDEAGGGSSENAHLDIEVTESKLHIDQNIAGIKSGDEKTFELFPIPFSGIPNVADAEVNLAVAFGDSMDSLYIKLGLDVCATVRIPFVGSKKLCGGKLTKALPIWLLNERYEVPYNICKPPPTPTPTPSPTPSPTPPSPTPTPTPAPTPTPTPTPTPPTPSYPVCAGGQYDWAGQSKHRDCSTGCGYNTCEQKIQEGKAVEHCYTKAQINEGKTGNGFAPRGCNYGSADNTCAYDDNNQCVYSDLDSLVAV